MQERFRGQFLSLPPEIEILDRAHRRTTKDEPGVANRGTLLLMSHYRWYATRREVLSIVLGGGLMLAVVFLLGLDLSGILAEDVGDADAAAAVCEEYVRTQPNVPATAVLDYDVEPGGDDFVIVGFVLGEGLVADGVPAERIPPERIISDGSSSFLHCTVRYHDRDGSYELLRGSVTKTPLAPCPRRGAAPAGRRRCGSPAGHAVDVRIATSDLESLADAVAVDAMETQTRPIAPRRGRVGDRRSG